MFFSSGEELQILGVNRHQLLKILVLGPKPHAHTAQSWTWVERRLGKVNPDVCAAVYGGFCEITSQ